MTPARGTAVRRAVLVAAAAGAAGLAATQSASAATDPAHLHLLRRATYGPTDASLAELAALGRDAWLDQQLRPATLPDAACDTMASRWSTVLAMPPSTVRRSFSFFASDPMRAMLENTMGRAIWSRRQLFEVMVAFWANHLHIPGYYYDAWDSRHHYDQTVIRPHALGRFSDMLQAAIRHPAMLRYLDQSNSKANKLNENLGRELLELHTLGVGNFTEADVLTSARVLTGLSIGDNGDFEYRTSYHHVGALSMPGWSSANTSPDGQATLTSFLTYLALHPKTADRIARKLAIRFVSDAPADWLVARIAKVYRATGSDIPAVLRYIFTSSAFAASIGSKLRTPQEDTYALVRALGYATPASGSTELNSLYWGLNTTGHAPMNWAPPNGFPDVPQLWATPGTALARLNLRLGIVADWWPNFTGRQDPKTLLPTTLPATHGDLVAYLGAKLLFAAPPTQVVAAICTFLGKTPSSPLTATSSAVGWRLPYVIALLFDSPAHQTR